MTMLTLYPRSEGLCRHCVRVGLDYADTVSTWSVTTQIRNFPAVFKLIFWSLLFLFFYADISVKPVIRIPGIVFFYKEVENLCPYKQQDCSRHKLSKTEQKMWRKQNDGELENNFFRLTCTKRFICQDWTAACKTIEMLIALNLWKMA